MSNVYENEMSRASVFYINSGQDLLVDNNITLNHSSQAFYQDSDQVIEFSKIYDYNDSNSRRVVTPEEKRHTDNPYFSRLYPYDKDFVFGQRMNDYYNSDYRPCFDFYTEFDKTEKPEEAKEIESSSKEIIEEVVTASKCIRQEIIDFEKIEEEPETVEAHVVIVEVPEEHKKLPVAVDGPVSHATPRIIINNSYHEETSHKIKEILVKLKTDLDKSCETGDSFTERSKILVDADKKRVHIEEVRPADQSPGKLESDIKQDSIKFEQPNVSSGNVRRGAKILTKLKTLRKQKETSGDEKKSKERYIQKSKNYISRKKSFSKSFLSRKKSEMKNKLKRDRIKEELQKNGESQMRKDAEVFVFNDTVVTDSDANANKSKEEARPTVVEASEEEEEFSMPVRNLQDSKKDLIEDKTDVLTSSEDEECEVAVVDLVDSDRSYDRNLLLKAENKKLELKLEELNREIEMKIDNIRGASSLEKDEGDKKAPKTEAQSSSRPEQLPTPTLTINSSNNKNRKAKMNKLDLKGLTLSTKKSSTSTRVEEPIYVTKAYMQPGVYSYLVTSKPLETPATSTEARPAESTNSDLGNNNSVRTSLSERHDVSGLKNKTKDFFAKRGNKLRNKVKEQSRSVEKKRISEPIEKPQSSRKNDSESEDESDRSDISYQVYAKKTPNPSVDLDVEFVPIRSENMVIVEDNVEVAAEETSQRGEVQLPPKNMLRKNEWRSAEAVGERESGEYSVPTNIKVDSDEDEVVEHSVTAEPIQGKLRQRNSFILDNMLGIKQADSTAGDKMFYREPVVRNVDFDLSRNQTVNVEKRKKRLTKSWCSVY